MATVCGTCGERNAPDAQFCVSCHSYLRWQVQEAQARLSTVGSADSDHAEAPSATSAARQPAVPARQEGPSEPFVAAMELTEVTVPADGTPATLEVNVANTSSVVDSYVVSAVDTPPWLVAEPSTAELLPSSSGTIVAVLRIESGRLVPEQRLPVALRVTNTSGQVAHRDLPVMVTVPVVTAPLQVRAEPQQVRVRDTSPAVCRIVVRNSGTNRWAQVRLSARDPAQEVAATWSSQLLQLPPGGEEAAEVRLVAPAPEGEVSRTVTISAYERHRRADTTVTLIQSGSQPAMELVSIRLDPSVLRLQGRRRVRVAIVVDNRQGTTPVNLALRGRDPERALGFAFSSTTLHVEPGRHASTHVTVMAPRTPPGQEVVRPFTIAATDGQAEAHAEGSVIQLAPSRRGLARVGLTLLGGLLLVTGLFGRFVAGIGDSAFDLTIARGALEIAVAQPQLGTQAFVDAGGLEDVVSIGLVLVVLAAFMVFGLTGRSGRLTRMSALLGLLVIAVTVLGSIVLGVGSGPGVGALVAASGCVAGYVGGLVARR